MKAKPNLDAEQFIHAGTAAGAEEGTLPADRILMLPRNRLCPNHLQDRDDWDSKDAREHIQSLANSMLMKLPDGTLYGIRRALEVMPADEEGTHEIISGENRWRAAEIAKIDSLPCVIRHADSTEARLDHNTENALRRDLTLWQQANAVRRDADEAKLTTDQIIISQGLRNKSHLSKIRAVFTLSEEAQELVRLGLINNVDYIYELKQLDPKQLKKLARKIQRGMPAKQALNSLLPKKSTKGPPAATTESGDPDPTVSSTGQDDPGADDESLGRAGQGPEQISLQISLPAAAALAQQLGIDVSDDLTALSQALQHKLEALAIEPA